MMFFSFPTLLALAVLAIGRVTAYANPGACSGDCWTHDPAVVRRSDGTYFRFSTGSKIGIYTASSLSGPWTFKGSALPSGSSINLPGKDDLWAPDVQLVGSTYHLYYSVSTFGSQNSAIGYATSTTLEPGSWTDHGSTGVTSASGNTFNAIDANVFSVGGAYYMNFGSFWGDIFQVRMNSGATQSSGSHTNIAFTSENSQAREGSFMFARDGYYYLFFSDGKCCGYDTSRPAAGQEYKIKVCRASSPTGPFADKSGKSCMSGGGTVVLESHGTVYGPGGQGIFSDPTHGTVLYYHYVDTTVGYADGNKRFGWNVVNWSGGWPVV